MGARENLQRMAERKSQEIAELERQIDLAKSYHQALQDAIKSLPRDAVNMEERSSELRPGSLMAKAKNAIEVNGKPMHVNEILMALGIAPTKASKVSLVGSLGSYVRKGLIFSRPAPNTFGLISMKSEEPSSRSLSSLLPIAFGTIEEK